MSKRLSVLLIIALSGLLISAGKRIGSTVFEWDKLPVKKNPYGSVRTIIKSPTRSLEMFEIRSVTLIGGILMKEYKVSKGYDELIIIKDGTAEITVSGKRERLGEGSIAVASEGDAVQILNASKTDLTFYLFRFRPLQNENNARNSGKTEPFFRNWQDIEYKTNANGGRRDIMRQPTSLLKELEIHTTQLREGLPSHSAHTHPDEEIILVRFGKVEESVSGTNYQCGPGSVIFLTNVDNHGISNAGQGPCEYYAIRWLTY